MLKLFVYPILEFFATVAYALALAYVLMIVGFTGGQMLDVWAMATGPHAVRTTIISIFCWAVLLALPAWVAVALVRKFNARGRDQK
ncbi:hypothetical protein GRI62_09800 [Erythrobacter arachoides]|uniref:Uncharacterized protein n=1 Tax=Aurantiacibacter arachoides TaxID=1850444 RepID=A0A845A437_9SPHN|nr:hypothetical protein [Aurantiacibacter arachoides]MXO93896.1 hypothetical protein [Aurantiacibacter arachoides]